MSEYQKSRCPRPTFAVKALMTGVSGLALVLGAAGAAQAQSNAPTQLQAPAPSGTGTQGAAETPTSEPGVSTRTIQLQPAVGTLMTSPDMPERTVSSIFETADTDGQSYSDIENRLLRQARFWEERFNREAAIEVLEKVLSINPRNERALFHLGRHEAQRGNVDEARRYLQRLQSASADPQLVSELQTSIRLYQNQGRLLTEARRLAQAGDTNEALAQYRTIFDGRDPTGEVAIEFYHTLAGDGGDWESAVAGLRREIQRDPNNRTADFTLAEVLTYKEATRREGLDRLRRFSSDPAFAERAARGYRNGLLWLNATLEDRTLYEEYLATFPEDTEMQAKFTRLIRPPVLAEATPLVNEAYRALYDGDLDEAERQLRMALQENANDADALAALGIVELRRERFAQSEAAFARAIAIDPEVRERIDEAYRSATFWSRYNAAVAERNAGNFQNAERMLLEIQDMAVPDNHWARVALADTYVRMNRLERAEELYKAVLVEDDDNAAAVMGLVGLYQRRGNIAEALQYGRKLSAEDRREFGLSRVEAQMMRARAEAAIRRGQTSVARRELEAAVRRMPNDPWLRLDYASVLLNTGNRAAADRQMAEIVQRFPNGVETRQANAVYRSRVGDWPQVVRIIESLPNSARNKGMRDLLAEARFSTAITAVRAEVARGNTERALDLVQDLERTYGGTPERDVLVADAYMAAGDGVRAVAIVRNLIPRANRLSPGAVVRMADILGQQGHRDEGNRLLADLSRRNNLPSTFSNEIERVRVANVISRARTEFNRGAYEKAFDTLTPVLTENPRNGDALRLAGEIHLMTDHSDIAYEYFARAISVNPEDRFSISGAVGAAIAAEDIDAASRLLEAAIARMPEEPSLYYLAADIAQAAGNKEATREALEIARRLQRPGEAEAGPALGNRTPGLGRPILRRGPTPSLDDEASLIAPKTTNHAAASWAESIQARLAAAGADNGVFTLTAASDYTGGAEIGGAQSASSGDRLSDLSDVLDTTPDRPSVDTYVIAQAENQYEADRVRRMLRGISDEEQNQAGQSPRVIPLRTTPLEETQSTAARFNVRRAPRTTEERLQDLRWELDTTVGQDIGARRRPGERGISRVFEVSSTTRGETNLFGGRAYLAATPTFVTAGDEATGRSSYRRFGSNAADPVLAVMDPAVIVEEQAQAGVGIEAGWNKGRFHVDLGATPLGFTVVNFVGGMRYDFDMGDEWFLRLDGHRRAVKDSVLSFAGSEDTGNQDGTGTFDGTGENFGGVTRSGISATLLRDFGQFGIYAGLGYDIYKGENIEANDYYEATAGAYFLPVNRTNEQLQIGYNTTYFAFDENRSFFTLGHGGYFSPQTFVSASIPVDYRFQQGPLRYSLVGAIGVQYFDEDTEPFFPDNEQLQQDAAQFLEPREKVFHTGEDSLEVAYRLGGEVAYRLGERVEFNASALHDDTAGYTETSARLGFRYRFGAE